ncbi:MAG: prepilin-type N-terminal cleavage/methylation domain-containing protein [Candidatus Omnitrophica bacterium]|nr:prepilin-type N-terminal cleavage/methylation domain-containing protein [Candidatus Omnitrophota bacterium]
MPGRTRSLKGNTRPSFLEKGFTLLEILITTLVLALGVFALSQAFNAGVLSSTDAENADLALNIAQAKMEELRNTNFTSLASSGPTADPGFPNFNTTVTVSGSDPKTITVAVAWNVLGPASTTNVTLTTLRANY